MHTTVQTSTPHVPLRDLTLDFLQQYHQQQMEKAARYTVPLLMLGLATLGLSVAALMYMTWLFSLLAFLCLLGTFAVRMTQANIQSLQVRCELPSEHEDQQTEIYWLRIQIQNEAERLDALTGPKAKPLSHFFLIGHTNTGFTRAHFISHPTDTGETYTSVIPLQIMSIKLINQPDVPVTYGIKGGQHEVWVNELTVGAALWKMFQSLAA